MIAKARVTFERFATDPLLMGGILGADTYLPMRACIKAALVEPLTVAEQAIFKALSGGRLTPEERIALLLFIAGRSGGKTEVAGTLVIYLGTCVDWPVKPGQVPIVALAAGDREQAGVGFRYVKGQLESSPLLSQEIANVTASSIELKNGVIIRVITSDYASVRGPTYAAVVCDEIAYWPTSLTSASPDVEVIAALRPGLARMPGSMLIMISSPYAMEGVLYETYRRSFGQDDAHTLVVRGGTRDFNATFPQEEIDRAMAEDPERFGAEYLAHFRSDVAAFIDAQLIDSNTRTEPREYPKRLNTKNGTPIRYVAGLDASGGRSDATACAVAHRDDNDLIVIDAVRRWPSPHDPAQIAVEAAAFLKVYGLDFADADQYAAGFSRSVYQAAGIALSDAPGTRSDAYLHLLPLLAQGKVELPPDPVLRVELMGLQRRTRSGGRDTVDHRPGSHDDVSNATALAAWHAARTGTDPHAQETLVIRSTILDEIDEGVSEYQRWHELDSNW